MNKFSFDDADARFFKGQVGAHVHKYRWSVSVPLICGCGAALLPDDIERIVNATERLSAEQARRVSRFIRLDDEDVLDKWNWAHEALDAYAAALEQ